MIFFKMKLGEFDQSGRRRPDKSDDDTFTIEADQIIAAISQVSEADKFLGDSEVKLNSRNYIKAAPLTGQSDADWIFAGGDAVTGPWSVIEAVAAGERAAVGMDEFLSGEKHAFWREEKELDTCFDPEADPVPYPREKQPLIPAEKRCSNFDEVEQSWSEAVAVRQAKRCLRCDYGK